MPNNDGAPRDETLESPPASAERYRLQIQNLEESRRECWALTQRLRDELDVARKDLFQFQQRNERLYQNYALLFDQFEAVKDLEEYFHLSDHLDRSPGIDKHRLLNEFVSRFVDTVGTVAVTPQRRALEIVIRDRLATLLTQIESLDARLKVREEQLAAVLIPIVGSPTDQSAVFPTRINAISQRLRSYLGRVLKRARPQT